MKELFFESDVVDSGTFYSEHQNNFKNYYYEEVKGSQQLNNIA